MYVTSPQNFAGSTISFTFCFASLWFLETCVTTNGRTDNELFIAFHGTWRRHVGPKRTIALRPRNGLTASTTYKRSCAILVRVVFW